MESVPGAVALFSAAYQRQTGQSLGVDQNLTGSDAIKALQKAMKDRKVTGSILTTAAEIASERANKGGALDRSARTAQAEQARFQNQTNDLMMLASQSGVEEGYARLFRTLNDGLKESGPLVKALAQGFNEASEKARLLLLLPQSFQRLLEGRSSFITQLVGEDKAEEIRSLFRDLETFGTNFSNLTTTIANGWSAIFTTMNNMEGLSVVQMAKNNVGALSNAAAGINRAASGDWSGAWDSTKSAAGSYFENITRIPRAIPDLLTGGGVSNFFGLGQDSMTKASDAAAKSVNSNTTVTIGDVNITTSATTPEALGLDVREQMRNAMSDAVKEAGLNYPRTGR